MSPGPARPAQSVMCLEIGSMANRPPDAVLRMYRRHKGEGRGVIAKQMGIAPGSAGFHARKRGDSKTGGRA